jgi:hypothetical protein
VIDSMFCSSRIKKNDISLYANLNQSPLEPLVMEEILDLTKLAALNICVVPH